MPPDDTKPSPDAHSTTPTALCGATFERRYVMKDRLARGLFNAVCQSMGVDAYTRSTSSTAPIYVTADAAVHARLWARWVELVPLYGNRPKVAVTKVAPPDGPQRSALVASSPRG